MKTVLILLSVLLIDVSVLCAQSLIANICPLREEACLNTPYNGTIDLANPAIPHTIPATPLRRSYAKATLNPNFGDVKYVNDELYDPIKCPAPSNDQCDNDGSSLIYD